MTRRFVAPITILLGTMGAAACGQSHDGMMMSDDLVAQYGAHLEQARAVSQEHLRTVQRARTLEEVTDEEQAHAERMDAAMDDLDHCTGPMGGCMHGSETTLDAARGDIEAMRSLHEQHHEAMLEAIDLESAQATESQHQQRARGQFEVMADHHEEMMGATDGSACGMH